MGNHLIGLYGGSFNPFHYGHLNVAISILEACELEKVLICPTFSSAFNKPLAPAKSRAKLVELAIKNIAGLELCDLEIKREGISYTIDTLRELQKKGMQIRLILSDDLIPDFHLWKESEAIIKNFSPIVATRKEGRKEAGFEYIKTRVMQISSTEIRDRLSMGLPCQHLMPYPEEWVGFF
jgi:nicotinate-nucleotide adenylyltransferase